MTKSPSNMSNGPSIHIYIHVFGAQQHTVHCVRFAEEKIIIAHHELMRRNAHVVDTQFFRNKCSPNLHF